MRYHPFSVVQHPASNNIPPARFFDTATELGACGEYEAADAESGRTLAHGATLPKLSSTSRARPAFKSMGEAGEIALNEWE